MLRPNMRSVGAVLLAAAMAGCGKGEPGLARAKAPATVVDSVVPVEVALARFRADLPVEPDGLARGSGSREALVREVVRALAQQDTAALEPIALDRAEFAYLYFPTAPLAHPPYELPPTLAWFQMQEANRKGVFRALREFGGKPWRVESSRCDAEPTIQGENRIWGGCTVTMREGGGAPVTAKLFGAILERGGRFKILSYANDL